MRREHTIHMRCPVSGGELALRAESEADGHVMSGELVSAAGVRYPIIEGVPDMRGAPASALQAESERSFGTEWELFDREGWDARTPRERLHFYEYTRLIPAFLTGKRVLDAGCGNGRYIKVASEAKPEIIVGADISRAAHVAFRNTRDMANVLIVRADLTRLPLAPEFDVIYSIGVLHHTPSARSSFAALAGICRRGGLISLYLYGRGNPVLARTNNFLRNRVGRRMPQAVLGGLLRLPAAVVAVVRWIPVLGPFVLDVVNRVIYLGNYHNMYDAYTAGFTSFHTAEEVEEWYHAAGCSCHISVRQRRTALYCLGQVVGKGNVIDGQREKIDGVKELLYALFA